MEATQLQDEKEHRFVYNGSRLLLTSNGSFRGSLLPIMKETPVLAVMEATYFSYQLKYSFEHNKAAYLSCRMKCSSEIMHCTQKMKFSIKNIFIYCAVMDVCHF